MTALPGAGRASPGRQDAQVPADASTYWFRRKRHGWGWSLPATWQGWVAYAVHLAVVIVAALVLPLGPSMLILVVATVVLIAVAYRHGEPPKPAEDVSRFGP